MALPNLVFDPIVKPYVQQNLDVFANTVDKRIADYDEAAEMYDALGAESDKLSDTVLQYDADQKVANDITNKYRAVIEEAATAGDYENMLRKAKRAGRDFMKDIYPLQQRAEQISAMTQEIRKREDLTQGMKNAALQQIQAYNNRLDETGNFLPIQSVTPGKYVDLSKMADDRLKGIKENGRTQLVGPDQNGNIIKRDITDLSFDEVKAIAASMLAGSAEVTDYGATMQSLGLGEQFNSELNAAVNAVAAKYEFSKSRTSIESMKMDSPNGKGGLTSDGAGITIPSQLTYSAFSKAGIDDKMISNFFANNYNKSIADGATNVREAWSNIMDQFFRNPDSDISDEQMAVIKKTMEAYEKYAASTDDPIGPEQFMREAARDKSVNASFIEDAQTQKRLQEQLFSKDAQGGFLLNGSFEVLPEYATGDLLPHQQLTGSQALKELDINVEEGELKGVLISGELGVEQGYGPRSYLVNFNGVQGIVRLGVETNRPEGRVRQYLANKFEQFERDYTTTIDISQEVAEQMPQFAEMAIEKVNGKPTGRIAKAIRLDFDPTELGGKRATLIFD